MLPKEKQLYDFCWVGNLNTYTQFGELVLGYYNTSDYQREKYFNILKKLKRDDDDVKTHILACHHANDMKKHPEDFGKFGKIFVNFYKTKFMN